MSELHPLADRYLDLLYDAVPDELRARKDLEDALAAQLTGGNHVCIRGFWRIGKTTLLKGVLARACERSGGAAIFLDLRDPERPDGLPQTADAVLARLAKKVTDFLKAVGATELVVDPKSPLTVLGELAAPLYVGLDEVLALHHLGPEAMVKLLDAMLSTPKNVRVALVAHRHRDVDALFETALLQRPGMASAFVPLISDDELVALVNTPAQAEGVTFSNEALGALAEVSGNRPWELVSFCALAAMKLPKGFTGEVGPDAIDALVNLDELAEVDEGRALVDNVLRMLVTAMTPAERALCELLAVGGEGEVPEDAIASLEAAGLVSTAEGLSLHGALFAGIVQAVASGAIKVSVEGS
ncbi:MAG: hypothetical protein SFW67_09285 [Myxococcaceae bacterium]|nr:hypothetical protein [Myxococcaceae bacterium]